jgi:hypothetical protein
MVVIYYNRVALWLMTDSYGYGKRGGGEKQFELLLVIINDGLEEPSDLVWL